jgi:hypothetical protein
LESCVKDYVALSCKYASKSRRFISMDALLFVLYADLLRLRSFRGRRPKILYISTFDEICKEVKRNVVLSVALLKAAVNVSLTAAVSVTSTFASLLLLTANTRMLYVSILHKKSKSW